MVLEQQIDGFARARAQSQTALVDDCRSGAATDWKGPERRAEATSTTRWLAQMLDEVDYGMLLLVDAARVLHANHAARMELDAEHPLQVVGDTLRVREAQDLMPLHQALLAARGGQRKLVTLGRDDGSVSVAVTPLGLLGLGGPAATLLLLGKRKVCATLTVQMFARCHGLTPAEARVLEALSAGIEPRELTQLHGVALTTVRTQIAAIRLKVGAQSIGDVLRRVAVLPPVVGALRGVA
jgi:DNA-binding CsgD family transcriptional regulator